MSYKTNRMLLDIPEQMANKTSMGIMFMIAKEYKLNANKKQNQMIIKRIIINCIKNN